VIVSQYDIYLKDAVLDALSPPIVQFAIWWLFIELLWNNAEKEGFFQAIVRIVIGSQIDERGSETASEAVSFMYISYCYTITTQTLNWRQRTEFPKMRLGYTINPAKKPWVYVWSGYQPCHDREVWFFGWVWIWTEPCSRSQPGPLAGYPDPLLTLDMADTFATHQPNDYAIDLGPGLNLPHGQMFKLSELKFNTLKAYIETNLANGFIQCASWRAAVPNFFVKMNDGGLQLCVNYRALNTATVKNQYLFSLIPEMLDRLCRAWMFTKHHRQNAYQLMWMIQGEEYKTVCCTRYGQFQSQVKMFVSSNALAPFWAYIDHCLRPFVNNFAVCYLNDILIY